MTRRRSPAVERLETRRLCSVAIASGQTIAGQVATAGQTDAYAFTAVAGESVQVSVGDATAASAYAAVLTVYGPDGVAVGTDQDPFSGGSAEVGFTVPTAAGGAYTAVVAAADGTTGAYNVELAAAPAPQAAEAGGDGGMIVAGQPRSGTINRPGDLDVYTFSASAGDAIALTVARATAASTFLPKLRLYNPAGAMVGLIYAGDSFGTPAEVVYPVPPTGSGTYTAVVQDATRQGTGSAYTLTLAGTVHPVTRDVAVIPAAAQSATTAVVRSVQLGTFTAATAGPYTVAVDWGDGTNDTTFTLTAAGPLAPQPHAFATAGAFAVAVTVTDSVGNSSATVTVPVAATAAAVPPPAAVADVLPTAVRGTLPASAATGVRIGGRVLVTIANPGAVNVRATEAVAVYATATGDIDAASVSAGDRSVRLSLRPGRSATVVVPVRRLSLPAGTYTLSARVTDPDGGTATAVTGPTVVVAAPFASLSAVVRSVAPLTVPPGRTLSFTLTIVNGGNVNSAGRATIEASLSADGRTPTVGLATVVRPVTVRANGPAVSLRLRVRIPSSVPDAATFYPFVVFSQAIATTMAAAGTPVVIG